MQIFYRMCKMHLFTLNFEFIISKCNAHTHIYTHRTCEFINYYCFIFYLNFINYILFIFFCILSLSKRKVSITFILLYISAQCVFISLLAQS